MCSVYLLSINDTSFVLNLSFMYSTPFEVSILVIMLLQVIPPHLQHQILHQKDHMASAS